MEQFLSLEISEILKVLLASVLPISELRIAIPLAILQYDFPWYYALLIAVIGNMLPIPFILLFLNAVSKYLSRIAFFNRFLNWLYARTKKKGTMIEKYEHIGLALFVGVPLPFTGAWTGAMAAVLLGLSFTRALISIFVGVLIAGVIVTCLTLLGWWGAIIAGLGLGITAFLGMRRMK